MTHPTESSQYPEPFELSRAAFARRRERDRRDGLTHLTHAEGLCGAAVAECCSECQDDEVKELREWAATAPPADPDETPGAYWRRLSDVVQAHVGDGIRTCGMWGDAWYTVAASIVFHRVEAVQS